jgi:hypothetical protein
MGGNPFAMNATTKAVARATFYCQFEVIKSSNVGKRAVFCDVAKSYCHHTATKQKSKNSFMCGLVSQEERAALHSKF